MVECDRNTCKHSEAKSCKASSLVIRGGICQTFSSNIETVKRICDCYTPAADDEICCCGTCGNWSWALNKCKEEANVLALAKKEDKKNED